MVTAVDDLSTGKIENLDGLLDSGAVTFVRTSILDLEKLTELFRGVSYVFHQAALPSVPRSIENPILVDEINIHGTLSVLEAARRNNVKKVMFASSSSVYGDTPVMPKIETMNPNPLSPYAVTKLAGEYYCQVFNSVYHLPTVCLRYFNVFGPRQNPYSQYSAVIPKFIVQLQQDKAPTIYGDGKQSRDFTYIKDVILANMLAARSDASGIYNVGSGNSTSINELTGMIARILGKNIAPVYEPAHSGDVKDSLASIEKARSFGYQPKYSLEQGLQETIQSLNITPP